MNITLVSLLYVFGKYLYVAVFISKITFIACILWKRVILLHTPHSDIEFYCNIAQFIEKLPEWSQRAHKNLFVLYLIFFVIYIFKWDEFEFILFIFLNSRQTICLFEQCAHKYEKPHNRHRKTCTQTYFYHAQNMKNKMRLKTCSSKCLQSCIFFLCLPCFSTTKKKTT